MRKTPDINFYPTHTHMHTLTTHRHTDNIHTETHLHTCTHKETILCYWTLTLPQNEKWLSSWDTEIHLEGRLGAWIGDTENFLETFWKFFSLQWYNRGGGYQILLFSQCQCMRKIRTWDTYQDLGRKNYEEMPPTRAHFIFLSFYTDRDKETEGKMLQFAHLQSSFPWNLISNQAV